MTRFSLAAFLLVSLWLPCLACMARELCRFWPRARITRAMGCFEGLWSGGKGFCGGMRDIEDARLGGAWRGMARHGWARQGRAGRCWAWRGMARRGMARLGSAGRGSARLGRAWQGTARRGTARQGKARPGRARHDAARQGKARLFTMSLIK